ncbi:hypothetical protein ACTHPH_21895 [Paenibacillus pasadenensis]|uniref:hypothetical protein n=1 Tax=Paenibacillus pasadenensis TaxID=217090 RepID=UPI0004124677|nr:hypothetical protein [Paenibacillus pasadenensis]
MVEKITLQDCPQGLQDAVKHALEKNGRAELLGARKVPASTLFHDGTPASTSYDVFVLEANTFTVFSWRESREPWLASEIAEQNTMTAGEIQEIINLAPDWMFDLSRGK